MGRTRGGRAGSPRGAVTRQHPVSGADRRLDGELGTGGQSAPLVTRFASHSGSRSPALVSLRIREFYATQAFYAPGDPLTLRAEIESSSRRDAPPLPSASAARAVQRCVGPKAVPDDRPERHRRYPSAQHRRFGLRSGLCRRTGILPGPSEVGTLRCGWVIADAGEVVPSDGPDPWLSLG